MTKRSVHVNPQSEMVSQHETKSGCYNHCAHYAGIFVLPKSTSTIKQIKDADQMLLFAGPTLYRMDQL